MNKHPIENILNNWQYLALGLDYSPEDFYRSLENRIGRSKVEIIKTARISFSQKGWFSNKREYLRVVQGDLIYDICGAPYGESFFFSYWMGVTEKRGCLGLLLPVFLSIPFIGAFVENSLQSITYYERDTAMMFNTLMTSIVMEEVDDIIGKSEIEAIPDEERVPNDKKLRSI